MLTELFNAELYARQGTIAFREEQHPRSGDGKFSAKGDAAFGGAPKLPGTVSPIDPFIPKPTKPLPGQRSMVEAFNTAFSEAFAAAVQRYKAAGDWITIGGHAKGGKAHAGGTPVKVEDGKIVAGPDKIEGKRLDDIDKDKNPQRDTGHRKFDVDGVRLHINEAFMRWLKPPKPEMPPHEPQAESPAAPSTSPDDVPLKVENRNGRWFAQAEHKGKSIYRSDEDRQKAIAKAKSDIEAAGGRMRDPDAQAPTPKPKEPEAAPAPQPKMATPEKGSPKSGPGTATVGELHVDPNRFQYKLNTNKAGVTHQFSDIRFNPEFAGTLHVWHDPDDGKSYVVNGHHRHDLAERTGYKGPLQVHYLNAANAEEARAKGALINIAGGNGTAVDAAKFMRDTGTTADEMKTHGVSLKGQVAKDASVLSGLSNSIFQRLAIGTYRHGRALAIAQHLPAHEDQDRLDKWISGFEESKNRELSDGTIEEMAREAAMAGRATQTTKGLFGEESEDRSLFVERAELKGAMRRDLTGRVNKFRAVATNKAANVLEGANTINAEENRRTADRLAKFLDDFDRETTYKGPVSERLNQAAQELAREPKRRKQIIDDLTADIRKLLETVPEADPGAAGGVAEGSGEPGQQYQPAAGQKGFFSRRFDPRVEFKDAMIERYAVPRNRLAEYFDRELYARGFTIACKG